MKTAFPFLLPLLALLLFQCAGNGPEYITVQVAMEKNDSIDITAFDRVYYRGFDLKPDRPEKDLNLEEIVTNYFIHNFSALLDRDILSYPDGEPEPGSLVIGGDIVLQILERNVIKKIGRPGKRENEFVKVENWSLELKVQLIAFPDREVIYENSYKKTLDEADPDDPYYNFKTVFNYCADQFARQVSGKERVEQRYLLLGR